MYVPPVVAMDFETALLDGTPSVDYYRADFRVVSAAFAWCGADGALKSLFLEGENEIRVFLSRLRTCGTAVVVHNFQLEYGAGLYRFSGFESLIKYDTMRLTQVGDNGGKHAAHAPALQTYDDLLEGVLETSPLRTGLSLQSAVSRWLDKEFHNHKEPFHAWLRDRGVKKGQEGLYLTNLPSDMFEAYNIADAIVTLLLYETLTAHFAVLGYAWDMDHELYMSTARMVAKAKGRGVRVDVAALEQYTAEIETEIAGIETAFRAFFQAQVTGIETERHNGWVKAAKTVGTREKRALLPPERFNLGSNKQLKWLFVDTLGITPKFWTKQPKLKPGQTRKREFVPAPSFKAAHLSTYGDGGQLLIKRRKRLLVLQQARALIKLAKHDGRWHCDIRACGTATGRMAGGGVR